MRLRSRLDLLTDDRIVVWCADLDDQKAFTDLPGTLSKDEREKAGRYRFKRDRERYVAARNILRKLIGNFLGISSEEVRFVYGEHGKPELEKEYSSLNFNISHSGPLALFAFAMGRRVGVDVERIDDRVEIGKLAQVIFNGNGTKGSNGFYSEWTRREAIGKAAGVGVSGVMGDAAEMADLEREFWTKEIRVPRDHVASVAAEGPIVFIDQRQWSEN